METPRDSDGKNRSRPGGERSTSGLVLTRDHGLVLYALALEAEDENRVAESSEPPRPAPASPLDWIAARWHAIDLALYLAFASGCVGYVGSIFYSAMLHQTGGTWSAPLDDVFIHFDYARSTYRGHPFEWSPGNGFSSGNTSVTYPFVLALGYLVPTFRDLAIMRWAAIVAGGSVLYFFYEVRRFFVPLGRWAKYLVPPVVLSLGALDWSLVSGMENAFHLGVFALATGRVFAAERALFRRRDIDDVSDPSPPSRRPRPRFAAFVAGVACALLVLTRPESIVCVGAFAVFVSARAGYHTRRSRLGLAMLVIAPSVVALFGQAVANRMLTGEWSQAGALAKLALYHPYMSASDKWADWVSQITWVLARLLHHHFSDKAPFGYLVVALALVPLLDRRVRRYGLLLWAMVIGWLLVVSLNGQVRWQNERYTMAAVAFALVLAALGLATLVSRYGETLRGRIGWGARLGVAALACALFWHHQLANFRDQVWFFARASRNILDQQVTAGRRLADLVPTPKRVLVGDAGALVYASDIHGLDLIGLGGYHDFPFARAGRLGLGASLELIERMPADERPDVMAIYPSWWGDLPIFFGRYVDEVPVYGNVICGGSSKVIYRADWDPLDRAGRPRTLGVGERIVTEVDVGDLMSERSRGYTLSKGAKGWVVFRVLADPDDTSTDLFDAGRILAPGERETARVLLPNRGARLIARTASEGPATVTVAIDGKDVGKLEVRPSSSWIEPTIDLPDGLPPEATLELRAETTFTDFHVWIVGP